MLDPRQCGRFVKAQIGCLLPGCHPPRWIGSIEIVDRGSGWSPADRAAFGAELGDAQARIDDVHSKCEEYGFPKERHHVRVVIEKDVLYFEDEQGRLGQSYLANPSSSAWGADMRQALKCRDEDETVRGYLYAEASPEDRRPSARWCDAPVCPWLWYTP